MQNVKCKMFRKYFFEKFVITSSKFPSRFSLLFILHFTFCVYSTAQQVEEFSLVREAAVALNPAMVGCRGFIAGTGIFRKQFTNIDRSPYTAYLSMEGQLEEKNVGIGASFIHDQTGPTGRTGGTIAAAYQFNLSKKRDLLSIATEHSRFNTEQTHMLCIGISLSVFQYRLNGSELHPETAGDPTLYTNNSFKVYPDASFGIYYQWRDKLYAGISVPQVVGLNLNYKGKDGLAKIKRIQHLNFLIGGRIKIVEDKFSIDPVGALRWVNNAPPQGDIGLRFTFLNSFWLGVNYRSVSTAVFEAGFEVKNMIRLCYAYDLHANKYLQDIGSTHEILLAFRFNRQTLRDDNWLSGPRF